jgi:hypothetical protein
MASRKVKLDSPGIAEILKSAEVASEVAEAAYSVADYADHTTQAGVEIPVEVDTYTTDRAAAGVTLAHPAGLGIEAKYGVLARAASAAGLEVRLWKGAR